MRQEDKLKERAGNKIPYQVPEGYFESFKSKLMESLPDYPDKPIEKQLSRWQRIKPYVYLAAMFAGIWCMMQIFHRVSVSQQSNGQLDPIVKTMPAEIQPDSYDLYVDNSLGNDLQLQDEVSDLYPSMDDFEKDFYASL